MKILKETNGIAIEVENGSYVLDMEVVPKGEQINAVTSTENAKRHLSRVEKEATLKEKIQDMHEETMDAGVSMQVKTRAPNKPYVPTKAEEAEHNKTHLPYRSWCEACVQGKAPDNHHRRVQ